MKRYPWDSAWVHMIMYVFLCKLPPQEKSLPSHSLVNLPSLLSPLPQAHLLLRVRWDATPDILVEYMWFCTWLSFSAGCHRRRSHSQVTKSTSRPSWALSHQLIYFCTFRETLPLRFQLSACDYVLVFHCRLPLQEKSLPSHHLVNLPSLWNPLPQAHPLLRVPWDATPEILVKWIKGQFGAVLAVNHYYQFPTWFARSCHVL